MKNKLITILYNGGCYGTYLQWVINTLVSKDQIQYPFTGAGSSHLSTGRYVEGLEGWLKYTKSNVHDISVRFHPKTMYNCIKGTTRPIVETFSAVLKETDCLVYLHADRSSELLCIANYYSKIWTDWWDNEFVDLSQISKQWKIDSITNHTDIPIWIKRELLSFYLFDVWADATDANDARVLQYPNVFVIKVSDLLFNFYETISRLVDHYKIPISKSVINLLPYHQEMLSLQKYLTLNQQCDQIVNSVVGDSTDDINWSNDFILEVAVQHNLRELGYEIMCDGLDIFPSDSVSLRKLLYRP